MKLSAHQKNSHTHFVCDKCDVYHIKVLKGNIKVATPISAFSNALSKDILDICFRINANLGEEEYVEYFIFRGGDYARENRAMSVQEGIRMCKLKAFW